MASIHQYPGQVSPWKVTWREEGRQRSRRFGDRPSAQKFLGDLVTRIELGAHAPGEASRQTVHDFLKHWFDLDSATWELSTKRQRGWVIDRWIVPYLGGVRLRDLGIVRVKAWRAEIIAKGASNNTVNAASRVLSAALTSAIGEGLIPANPILSAAIKPLPQKPTHRRAIPLDQVEAIRAAMDSPRDRLIVSLLCYGGLRPGEIVALRVSDVREATILVGRSYGPGGIKGTKTGAVRAVPILEALREDLHSIGCSGLLVPGDRGGFLHWRNWNRRVWRPATTRLGMDWIPYESRHACASLLIASGKSVLEVAQWLGHANPNMTLNCYGHLMAEAKLKPGEDLDTLIGAARHAASP